MRKIILIIILIITVSCGTDLGDGEFYNYSLRNNSGKDVTIYSYRTIYPIRENPLIIQLADGENLTKTYKDALPPTGYNFGVFFNGDSLIINYNNERKQIFKWTDQNDRNPFNYFETNVEFIFTEQDFENAEPCNGNCD